MCSLEDIFVLLVFLFSFSEKSALEDPEKEQTLIVRIYTPAVSMTTICGCC